MKSKVVFLFVMIFASLVSISSAQKFSIQINGGYNFSGFGSVIGESDSVGMTSGSLPQFYTIESRNVMGSFGQGTSLGIDFGYKISEHISLNLGASILNGKKFIITPDYFVPDTFKANAIRINPGIVCIFNKAKKIQPFFRFELSVAFKSKMIDKEGHYPTQYVVTEKSSGYGLGFGAAIGIMVKASKNFCFNFEFNGLHQTYSYNKGEITEEIYNGQDYVSFDPFSYHHFIYRNIITESDNTDPDSPTVMLKEYYPFSSLGLKIGVTIFL